MKKSEHYFATWADKVHRDLGDSDVSKLCTHIVKFLVSDKAVRLKHITFGTLHSELKISWDEQEKLQLIKATDYLSSGRLHLLNMKFQLIDDPNSDPIPIEDQYISAAFNSGVLYNPTTGNEVENFKSKLFPYFEPTEMLMGMHAE